jgi:NAD+ kinase
MIIQKVGLIVKDHSREAHDLALLVASYMKKVKNWEVLMPLPSPESGEVSPYVIYVEKEEISRACQILVALGGDGTMLKAASFVRGLIPVLGVNLGRVGYLSTIPAGDVFGELDKLEQEPSSTIFEHRKMLGIVLTDGDKDLCLPALNEVAIMWAERPKLINLILSLDSEGEFEIRADGLIISTPTGSTAYNYAAGGPIVDPRADVMVVTPICPYSGLRSSLALSMSSLLRISSEERNGNVRLMIDGHAEFFLRPGQCVEIEEYSVPFVLVNPRSSNYFEVLKTKLHIIGNGQK